MKALCRISLTIAIATLILAARGTETGLAQNPAGNEAVIWYLGHCGFAVQTQRHLLIFDYQERRDGAQPKIRPAKPSLDEGWIDPEEIKGLAVRVFVSHSHEDHYDPIVLGWQKVVPDIAYYFGWKTADDPRAHHFVGPRAELASGGLKIATINSHHSGVPEVAWLVEVDGLVIFHNGDCQPENPASEYDFLKTKTGRIDLAFVPPMYEERWRYAAQNTDLFQKFVPRAVFPMHAQAGDLMYVEFKKAFEAKIRGLSVFVPRRMGDRFVFKNGSVQK